MSEQGENIFSNLPRIGELIPAADGEISPRDALKGDTAIVRCTINERGTWSITNKPNGLVVILKPIPRYPFRTIKITGHAKSGKCVFGKAVGNT